MRCITTAYNERGHCVKVIKCERQFHADKYLKTKVKICISTYAPSCDIFYLGSSYLNVALSSVHHLYSDNNISPFWPRPRWLVGSTSSIKIFPLVFYNIRCSKMHRFELEAWDRHTDRQTDRLQHGGIPLSLCSANLQPWRFYWLCASTK